MTVGCSDWSCKHDDLKIYLYVAPPQILPKPQHVKIQKKKKNSCVKFIFSTVPLRPKRRSVWITRVTAGISALVNVSL
jgi:hypothetical protein